MCRNGWSVRNRYIPLLSVQITQRSQSHANLHLLHKVRVMVDLVAFEGFFREQPPTLFWTQKLKIIKIPPLESVPFQAAEYLIWIQRYLACVQKNHRVWKRVPVEFKPVNASLPARCVIEIFKVRSNVGLVGKQILQSHRIGYHHIDRHWLFKTKIAVITKVCQPKSRMLFWINQVLRPRIYWSNWLVKLRFNCV